MILPDAMHVYACRGQHGFLQLKCPTTSSTHGGTCSQTLIIPVVEAFFWECMFATEGTSLTGAAPVLEAGGMQSCLHCHLLTFFSIATFCCRPQLPVTMPKLQVARPKLPKLPKPEHPECSRGTWTDGSIWLSSMRWGCTRKHPNTSSRSEAGPMI